MAFIANYIPLEQPAGGPNFPAFDDSVLYEIHVDSDGDGEDNVTYQFRFHTPTRNPDTFLYNVGTIASLTDSNWNRPQFYDVSVDRHGMPGPPHQDLGKNPAVATRQHRAEVHAELRRARRRGGADASWRHEGVRRTARRSLLRRPRVDLRSGRQPPQQ